jgi:hypothetical protein
MFYVGERGREEEEGRRERKREKKKEKKRREGGRERRVLWEILPPHTPSYTSIFRCH